MGNLKKEVIQWAYRIILEREANSKAVEHWEKEAKTVAQLKDVLMNSKEFSKKDPRVHLHKETIVIKELKWGRIYLDLSDRIGMEIARDQISNPRETQLIEKVLKKGDVVLDLGAHMGYYSVVMSSLVGNSGKVYAFEPNTELYNLLRKTRTENGWHDRLEIEDSCLTNQEGTVLMGMLLESGDKGVSHWSREGKIIYSDLEKVKVKSMVLSDYEIPEKIDFIKIDIEGSEMVVVRDFSDRIKADHPIILSEVNKPLLKFVSKVSGEEYIEEVKSYGYKCYNVNKEGNLFLKRGERNNNENVVFLPKDKTYQEIEVLNGEYQIIN